MASEPLKLFNGTLTTTLTTTLYTVPASTTVIVKGVTLCNYDTVARTVTLTFDATYVLNAYSIAANDSILIPFYDQVLLTTDIIKGGASANAVVDICISGKAIT